MKRLLLSERAISLRAEGYSYKEISQELNISKDTAFRWTKQVNLTKEGNARLRARVENAYLRARDTQSLSRKKVIDELMQQEEMYLNSLGSLQGYSRLLCAMIYWCEGTKDAATVRFTNSDPKLVKTFLNLFRRSFELDEAKFRVIVHLHDYHNESLQKEFWSDVTGIPQSQFTKSYLKPHTGKVKRDNYMGCVHIKYYDAKIAKALLFLAEAFMLSKQGGVG